MNEQANPKDMSSLTGFPDRYTVPEDQFAAEEAFASSHGDAHPSKYTDVPSLVSRTLRQLHAAAGVNPVADAAGNMARRVVRGQPGLAATAAEPIMLTRDGSKQINDTVRSETVSLLDGLYSLVGAQVIRDDRQIGQSDGVVVRRGQYHGRWVHVVEHYRVGGMVSLRVDFVGAEAADRIANQLSVNEVTDFATNMGWTVERARAYVVDNELDRKNLLGELAKLRGAADSARRRSLGDAARRLLRRRPSDNS